MRLVKNVATAQTAQTKENGKAVLNDNVRTGITEELVSGKLKNGTMRSDPRQRWHKMRLREYRVE